MRRWILYANLVDFVSSSEGRVEMIPGRGMRLEGNPPSPANFVGILSPEGARKGFGWMRRICNGLLDGQGQAPPPQKFWMDEETVYKIWLMDSISVGDGAIPHTPPLGEAASPDPTQFASQRVSGRGVFACVIRNRNSVDCDLAHCVIGGDFNWRAGHLEEKVLSAQPLGARKGFG
jgi:hypothetical protein